MRESITAASDEEMPFETVEAETMETSGGATFSGVAAVWADELAVSKPRRRRVSPMNRRFRNRLTPR
jgi:hypothetical protein